MATYKEVAPTISKVVDENTFKADFPEETPIPVVPPEVTNDKVLACYSLLKDIPGSGGIVKIAQQVGLTMQQVKVLVREVNEAKKVVHGLLAQALKKEKKLK